MIIGIHSRDNDLVVNPSKAKKLTNIRTTAADEKLVLDAAARAHARVGARVHQRRRARRGHAGGDPAAQALLDHNVRKRFEKARDAGISAT